MLQGSEVGSEVILTLDRPFSATSVTLNLDVSLIALLITRSFAFASFWYFLSVILVNLTSRLDYMSAHQVGVPA